MQSELPDAPSLPIAPLPMHAVSSPAVPSESTAKSGDGLIFGTFLIDGREFALSVGAIKEVVNQPKSYTRILPSPAYFWGVFDLRGFVVPVIDLRLLLGLSPDPQQEGARKVAIIEHGRHCFGLLVDATGDVVTARRSDHYAFSHDPVNASASIISGAFKRKQDQRIVQVLDPPSLLGLDQIPKVEGSLTLALTDTSIAGRRQCLSFRVGDCVCAFDMTCIREVVDFGGIENRALASWWTLGTIDLRGATVPVIDLRAFLNGTDTMFAEDFVGAGFKLIVLKAGTELLSFLVDSIKTIVTFHDEDVVRFPPVGLRRGELLQGGLTMDEKTMVLLLDHEQVLANEELLEVTEGFGKLFREGDASNRADRERNSRKKTYITFSIQDEFALDIRDVSEVLNFPENVTRPPNIPPFIEGVVNLRGSLIPIINPRLLYGLDPVEQRSTRLLIFSSGGGKYGMMVDRVGSIVNVADMDARTLQPIRQPTQGLHLGNDVKECLIIAGDQPQQHSLLILDLVAVLSRCGTV